jgi:FkbM family methyltransferase
MVAIMCSALVLLLLSCCCFGKRKELKVYRHYIFIDVGGNTGDTVERFLSDGIYGLPKPSHRFDAIYVFEPNNDFHHLYDKFKNQALNFTLIPSAATSVDGSLGFSGNAEGGSTISSRESEKTVSSINFSRWLGETVKLDDYVVCKIDAEGSEFEIMQRMFADGTLCLCDRLAIEWHGWLTCNGQDMTHFNSVADISDFPGLKENCTGSESICRIPHLNLVLPHYYCTLPTVLLWARKACVSQGSIEARHALENHDVNFFKKNKRS